MQALAHDINDSHLVLLDTVGQGGFGTVRVMGGGRGAARGHSEQVCVKGGFGTVRVMGGGRGAARGHSEQVCVKGGFGTVRVMGGGRGAARGHSEQVCVKGGFGTVRVMGGGRGAARGHSEQVCVKGGFGTVRVMGGGRGAARGHSEQVCVKGGFGMVRAWNEGRRRLVGVHMCAARAPPRRRRSRALRVRAAAASQPAWAEKGKCGGEAERACAGAWLPLQVYKGRWKGLLVAVKTLTFQDQAVSGGGKAQHTAFMEAAISTSLAHPFVVTTYAFDIKPLKVREEQEEGAFAAPLCVVITFACDIWQSARRAASSSAGVQLSADGKEMRE